MIAIRPVSDLQNKLTEIEEIVQQGEPVFLTKNGYGSMVVLSVEQYSALLNRTADRAADAVQPEDGAPHAAPAPAEEDAVQPEDGAPAPAPAGADVDEASDGARIHLKSHAPWCKPESPTLYVRKIHGFWTVMTEEQAASYWERHGDGDPDADSEDAEDFFDEML